MSSGATVVVSIGAGAASVAVVSAVESDSVDVSLQAAKAPIAKPFMCKAAVEEETSARLHSRMK